MHGSTDSIVSANAGTRRPKVTWFLGCYVSGLLRFSVACVLGFLVSLFPGGEERGGRKERNEGVRKEEVERSKEGRRGRRVTSLPEWSLWGVRKCTPKGPKKEPKRLPNLCLETSGRPLASLGGPWGGFKADFLSDFGRF